MKADIKSNINVTILKKKHYGIINGFHDRNFAKLVSQKAFSSGDYCNALTFIYLFVIFLSKQNQKIERISLKLTLIDY